jgi:hypothetical protein
MIKRLLEKKIFLSPFKYKQQITCHWFCRWYKVPGPVYDPWDFTFLPTDSTVSVQCKLSWLVYFRKWAGIILYHILSHGCKVSDLETTCLTIFLCVFISASKYSLNASVVGSMMRVLLKRMCLKGSKDLHAETTPVMWGMLISACILPKCFLHSPLCCSLLFLQNPPFPFICLISWENKPPLYNPRCIRDRNIP